MWYVQYSRCIFWTYFFIAAPIFYISILKLYHTRWYDIVSIILLYVGSIYVLTHNVLGQIMYFKSIGIITSHKFSNFILNTWSLIVMGQASESWAPSSPGGHKPRPFQKSRTCAQHEPSPSEPDELDLSKFLNHFISKLCYTKMKCTIFQNYPRISSFKWN